MTGEAIIVLWALGSLVCYHDVVERVRKKRAFMTHDLALAPWLSMFWPFILIAYVIVIFIQFLHEVHIEVRDALAQLFTLLNPMMKHLDAYYVENNVILPRRDR